MIKTNIELANKVKEIATKYKTLYVMGCFGAPLKDEYKDRYCNNYEYNKQPARTAMIKAASADTFGFDCVCLIKGVLWGWNGDKNAVYGGAKYEDKESGVPDIDCDVMINKCSGVSTDFSKIEVGEAVWMSGHIGVYIGDGLAVECTPKWENCVQITAVGNIGAKKGYNTRTWTKHGKLPYISYVATNTTKPTPAPAKDETLLPIGSVVKFTGNLQYGSSTSNKGVPAKAGTVKITSRAVGTPHPYHAISTDNSGVYGWVNASDIVCVEAAPTKPSKSKIEVNDIVQFKGGGVYVSAEAEKASIIKVASRCKVTLKSNGAKHPYHLISEDGKGVYGWVDKSSIE